MKKKKGRGSKLAIPLTVLNNSFSPKFIISKEKLIIKKTPTPKFRLHNAQILVGNPEAAPYLGESTESLPNSK